MVPVISAVQMLLPKYDFSYVIYQRYEQNIYNNMNARTNPFQRERIYFCVSELKFTVFTIKEI